MSRHVTGGCIPLTLHDLHMWMPGLGQLLILLHMLIIHMHACISQVYACVTVTQEWDSCQEKKMQMSTYISASAEVLCLSMFAHTLRKSHRQA